MSTAIRNTKIRKNLQEANRWLRDQGYDCIRGHWMKFNGFATLQRLPSGRVWINEGVHV
jgi:hypothetical protein